MMKRNYFRLMMLALMLAIFIPASAHDFEVDGIYYSINGDEVTVTKGNNNEYSGSVTIPSTVTYEGTTYSVTSIGDYAFEDCYRLTSVTIPNSVTTIGESAFEDCYGLTGVTIPNSVTTIGKSAFEDCDRLTSVTIGESVSSIGEDAFAYCSSLTTLNYNAVSCSDLSVYDSPFHDSDISTIIIGERVQRIPRYFGSMEKEGGDASHLVFFDLYNLASISVESGNTTYDSRDNCNAIIETASNMLLLGCKNTVIPNSVTTIGDCAFNGCSGLTSVDIPESVTTIGSYAFLECSGLTIVTIGESVSSIGEDAFAYCSSFTTLNYNAVSCADFIKFNSPFRGTPISTIIIGEHVQRIPASFACWLYDLTSVTISNSVTTIGEDAFSGCSSLTSVTIGNSVTTIDEDAFSGCSSLTSVTIPNSVTTIGLWAFEDCSGLTSVTIGNSVTSIGYGAFSGCSSLVSIAIPASVTSIGYGAFSGCSGLVSISVESGNTTFDSRDNCNAIITTASNTLRLGCKNTVIPNTVTAIGSSAFSGCNGLTNMTIPEWITSIGNNAFENCMSLSTLNFNAVSCADFSEGTNHPFWYTGISTINIGKSVQKIPRYFARQLSGLTSLSVESGNTIFDSRDNCNAIIKTASNTLMIGCMNTVIPNSVAAIADYAFSGHRGLTSVTIPNSVTSIGYEAFLGCSGLTSVTIGNSVTYIGNRAFYGCSLTSVTIPSSVTSIGQSAFQNCSGLTSVTIPNSVTYVGRLSFNGTAWFDNQPDGLVYAGLVAYSYKGNMPDGTNIEIREGTLSISPYAFYNCVGLTSVTIGNSVTTIGNRAFYGCSGLSSVTIPSSVTTIDEEAFSGCSGLTCVTISSSVTTIGRYAFSGCSGLTSMTCLTAVPPRAKSSIISNYSNATLYVPKGAVQLYQTTSYWKDFPTIVGIDVDVDMPGDVNNDGVLSIADVTGIISLLLCNGGDYLPLGDVNGDGRFTIADVTALIEHLLSGGK